MPDGTPTGTGSVSVSEARRAGLLPVAEALLAAQRVVLTTHVNADGDGAGCQAAVDAWLRARGKDVVIANPTPFPDLYRHLLAEGASVPEPGSGAFQEACAAADLLLVLDTGEPSRIGRVV